MMTRLRPLILVAAMIAFVIAAVAAAIAGEWSLFILAVSGGAVVMLWPRPAR